MKMFSTITVLALTSLVFILHATKGEGPTLGAEAGNTKDLPAVDRQEILDLISRYSYTWDGKNAEGWTALYLDNATHASYSGGEFTRASQSNKERLAYARERHQSFTKQGIQTRHYQTNPVLERAPDGTVQGETMFSVIWQYAGEPAPKLAHSGIYRDVFVKTASGWKFGRREVHVDHK